MNTHSNEKELYEILEKQRGAFCQIAFVYIFAVIIGFGLILTMQTTLGPTTPVIIALFLIGTTAVFSLLGYFSYIPVREIDEKVEKTLKHIIKQGLPEEGN